MLCLVLRGSCGVTDLQTHGDKQVDTDRRRYLTDRQVNRSENAEGDQAVAELLCDRCHDRDKNIHGGVCIDEAPRDEEDDIHDQQEYHFVRCHRREQRLRRGGDAEQRAAVGKK